MITEKNIKIQFMKKENELSNLRNHIEKLSNEINEREEYRLKSSKEIQFKTSKIKEYEETIENLEKSNANLLSNQKTNEDKFYFYLNRNKN